MINRAYLVRSERLNMQNQIFFELWANLKNNVIRKLWQNLCVKEPEKNTEKITFFIILIKFFMNNVTNRDTIICILGMFVQKFPRKHTTEELVGRGRGRGRGSGTRWVGAKGEG